MNKDFTFKDIIFVLIFSVVIFFGALFISEGFKQDKNKNQVSIEDLERNLNKNINEKLQRLHTRNRIFKSETIRASEGLDAEIKSEEPAYVSDTQTDEFKLNVFESKAGAFNKKDPQSISEKIMAQLEYERNFPSNQKSKIVEYKKELIEKARKLGWRIEVNDKLEVVSAERL